ncbi:hypothetical protein BSY240_502 [Agrobacterium sp. RAC06]|nr:hypothetical protein BSY240_502 [Agrobacterium sp. RAC06]
MSLPYTPSSSGLTRGSKHKRAKARHPRQSATNRQKKGDAPTRFPNKINKKSFFHPRPFPRPYPDPRPALGYT